VPRIREPPDCSFHAHEPGFHALQLSLLGIEHAALPGEISPAVNCCGGHQDIMLGVRELFPKTVSLELMALKATIYKVDLQIADMDRHYYASHALTVARHPSETDERMLVRVLAFALHAHPDLSFGRGLSTDDEPDLWQKDATGAIELWIDVGLPDERAIRKASGRARRVVIVSYGGRGADLWWDQIRDKIERIDNVSVIRLPFAATRELATLADRSMEFACRIQDGQVWIDGPKETLHLEPTRLSGS
jgi:uncharacterized protein YaeQ